MTDADPAALLDRVKAAWTLFRQAQREAGPREQFRAYDAYLDAQRDCILAGRRDLADRGRQEADERRAAEVAPGEA
jgi:hypothetical protein